MNKALLRKQTLEKRNQLSEAERRKADFLLTERILGHQWFYGSEYILAYVSYGSEASTYEIMREGLRQKKKVYVPKVNGDKMSFYQIASLDDLAPGYRGIMEPEGSSEEYIYSEERAGRTLMLMPGVAFDQWKNRIGYGKGFYDRYLSGKEQLILRSIAIGYQCQLVEEIPATDLDIKPYQVILN